MWAITVPVNILFEKAIDYSVSEDGYIQRKKFRLIETNGYYTESTRSFVERIHSSISFKCFIDIEDAWCFLKLYGIEKESDGSEESKDKGNRTECIGCHKAAQIVPS